MSALKSVGLSKVICIVLSVLCAAVLPLVIGKATVFISLKPDTFFISTDFYYYYKYLFFCVIGSLMILYTIISYFSQRKTLVLSKLYIAFVILVLVSSVFALNSSNAYFGIAGRYQGFYTYLFYFAVMVFCASFFTPKIIKIVLYALLVSASIIAVLALMQYYGIEFFFDPVGVEVYGRFIARGTIGNRNFLGSYFTLLTPIAAVLYFTAKTKKGAVVFFILTGLFFSGLVVSLTRVAWLGFLAFSLVMCVIQYQLLIKNFKRVLALLLLLILLFSLLTFSDGGRITDRGQDLTKQMQNVGEDSFGSGRMVIYRYVLGVIMHYPILGVGPDCLGNALESLVTENNRVLVGGKNVYIDKAHSEYLEIAATMGIPAFVCFMLFFTLLMLPLLKRFKTLPCTLQAVFCGVGAYLVQAAGNIGVISVLPVFYVLVGILLRYSGSKDIFTLKRRTDKKQVPTIKATV